MDGGFTAVSDVSRAMAETGTAAEYRLIGGMTVMLHVQRLRLGRGRVAHDRWHDAGRRHRPS